MSITLFCIVQIQIQIWAFKSLFENPFICFYSSNSKTKNFPISAFILIFTKNDWTFFEQFYFSVLCNCLIVCHYFVTLDYDVDDGVGPEAFEDPEDFVEPGKQPFDHVEALLHHKSIFVVSSRAWYILNGKLLGLPLLHTLLILALFMTLSLFRVVLMGCRNML